MQFTSARESMKSPLAKKLFQIDGVTNVFFGSDFVTVTKSDDYTWNVVKPDIFAGIMDHFTSGQPRISDASAFLHVCIMEAVNKGFCFPAPVQHYIMTKVC